MMEPLDLPLDSQAYTWQETEPWVFAISEVYKVSSESDVTIQTIGMWSGNIGGLAVTKTEFWQRRRNLQGMQFMAATLEVPLSNHPNKSPSQHFIVGSTFYLCQL